jgi:glycosyltransferase involved in cell wall biosynthesis
MKILFVNAVPNRGGAAKAARRIATSVEALGHDVQFLTLEHGLTSVDGLDRRTRLSTRVEVTLHKVLERLPVFTARRSARSPEFSSSVLNLDSSEEINRASPDVVNLHWVNYGQLSPEAIAAIRVPIVWTLHDMWAFTGGCHHSQSCERYTTNCGFCPILQSSDMKDRSRQLWRRKQVAWQGRSFRIITPSTWLAGRACRSSLLGAMPIRVVPNPLDLSVFCPGSRHEARARLGLPTDVPIVLFAAQRPLRNAAKGFAHLDVAMQNLRLGSARVHLAVLGHASEAGRPARDYPVHYLGYRTSDRDVVDAYRSANVFALPSHYENLPNTIAEALACGIPCVAFSVGGIGDMIIPGRNGYLARPYDADELRRAIEDCLSPTAPKLSEEARRHAERMFDASKIAQAYLEEFCRAAQLRMRSQSPLRTRRQTESPRSRGSTRSTLG